MKKKKKKYAITLIEIMIVIMLIGLIGGALAYNMRGSMDKGRQFKSEQAANRIKDILELEYASGKTVDEIKRDWEMLVREHPLGNEKILKDGWNNDFNIIHDGQEFVVKSPKVTTKSSNA